MVIVFFVVKYIRLVKWINIKSNLEGRFLCNVYRKEENKQCKIWQNAHKTACYANKKRGSGKNQAMCGRK